MAAFRVSEEVQLIAGYAKPRSLARSSISLYTSGVAMGMMALLVRGFRRVVEQYLPNDGAPIPRALDRSTIRRRGQPVSPGWWPAPSLRLPVPPPPAAVHRRGPRRLPARRPHPRPVQAGPGGRAVRPRPPRTRAEFLALATTMRG